MHRAAISSACLPANLSMMPSIPSPRSVLSASISAQAVMFFSITIKPTQLGTLHWTKPLRGSNQDPFSSYTGGTIAMVDEQVAEIEIGKPFSQPDDDSLAVRLG